MKTMGFQNNLILVNPKDGITVKQKKGTKESTSGAIDVLQNSKLFLTLDEALDCSFDDDDEDDNDKTSTAASTASTTKTTTTVTTIHLSLLFGNEKYGMNQNDIQNYCHSMLGIPTNPKFGSLNLASAVQIIAYDWRMAMNNGNYGNVQWQ
ncbi:hypothetical protein FRACYDRAFT_236394 [Fragilariopsis cylindrus CCMP1102]|uniref:tRNA/rRNA methyltransferase SpoU type domain-containing protein n=1 Tax=Fragilariopsis cylindrus CCMP1102 TaxID=635003 RepID=A0A1E7FQ66_9STRA|nr:hypothetical protein FRACYDRAFT_236394 [Fragilariopsis cylindrus CCMP1102]|eukprot:OEU20319.1 hypothetical protein FRACYDRAFT_236394 [Fragilariopsis cylindrus CCMP1102]